MKNSIIDKINTQSKNTLMETLGIIFTHFDGEILTATMPVNANVHQPFGMLHGGASVALAESLGSCLSNILVQSEGKIAVGTSINAHHLRTKTEGIVKGLARLIKQGKTLHLVEIEICDEEQNIICHATMNNMIIDQK